MSNRPSSTARGMTARQRSLASTLPANFRDSPLFTARPGENLRSSPLRHTSDFDDRQIPQAVNQARRSAGTLPANRPGALAHQPTTSHRITRQPRAPRAVPIQAAVQASRPPHRVTYQPTSLGMAPSSVLPASYAPPIQQHQYPFFQQATNAQPPGFIIDLDEAGYDFSMWPTSNTNPSIGSSTQYTAQAFGQQWPVPPATNAANRSRLTPQSSTSFSSSRYPGNYGSRQTAYPPTSRGQ